MSTPAQPSSLSAWRTGRLRTAGLAAGGLVIAAAGVAAGLAWRPAETDVAAPLSMEATQAPKTSLAPNERILEPAADRKAGVSKNAATRSASTSAAGTAAATPLATRPAAICTHCGVVEGVREVQVKGQGTGVGAVAGGVVGAAVGNQMGKGDGRKAMTVIGAIGGGLAGNEIEKRARGETAYDVRVRMDDGSLRTLRQKTAPAPGSRVTVEGNTLRTTRAPNGDGGQMTRTSAGT